MLWASGGCYKLADFNFNWRYNMFRFSGSAPRGDFALGCFPTMVGELAFEGWFAGNVTGQAVFGWIEGSGRRNFAAVFGG